MRAWRGRERQQAEGTKVSHHDQDHVGVDDDDDDDVDYDDDDGDQDQAESTKVSLHHDHDEEDDNDHDDQDYVDDDHDGRGDWIGLNCEAFYDFKAMGGFNLLTLLHLYVCWLYLYLNWIVFLCFSLMSLY